MARHEDHASLLKSLDARVLKWTRLEIRVAWPVRRRSAPKIEVAGDRFSIRIEDREVLADSIFRPYVIAEGICARRPLVCGGNGDPAWIDTKAELQAVQRVLDIVQYAGSIGDVFINLPDRSRSPNLCSEGRFVKMRSVLDEGCSARNDVCRCRGARKHRKRAQRNKCSSIHRSASYQMWFGGALANLKQLLV